MKTKPHTETAPAADHQTPATEQPTAQMATEQLATEQPAESQKAATYAPEQQDQPSRPVFRGEIERTLTRMISGWLKVERDRGYLTEEVELDAKQALQQLDRHAEELAIR